jgi:hypothetical protein
LRRGAGRSIQGANNAAAVNCHPVNEAHLKGRDRC